MKATSTSKYYCNIITPFQLSNFVTYQFEKELYV